MPRALYSYKLKREVPLLTDDEYQPIADLLRDRLSSIKNYRKMYLVSISDARAKDSVGQAALDLYVRLTGAHLNHPDHLYSVRLSDYGSPCAVCGKPFRTPKAKFCAEWGYDLPEGEVAGSATL